MSRKNKKGALLIELCIVMAVMLVLFAMSAPSFLAMRRAQQQTAAVEMMKRISKAELYHTQIYSDGFRSPGALAAVTFPKTCESSGLLSGMDALPQYAQYQFTFAFGPTQAALAPGCNFAGFTSYWLRAQPLDPSNRRSFFLSEDGLVRWSDDPNTPASQTSAVWTW
jgi:Tfp pilus assembly protein PilE